MTGNIVVTDSLVQWAQSQAETALASLESSVQGSPPEVDGGIASEIIATAIGDLVNDLATITENIGGLLSSMDSTVSALSATDDDVTTAVNSIGGSLQ